jgi:hypothetical protein
VRRLKGGFNGREDLLRGSLRRVRHIPRKESTLYRGLATD